MTSINEFHFHLFRECGSDYPYDVDVSDMFHTWEHHKMEDITSYRDKSFSSKFTGGAVSKVNHSEPANKSWESLRPPPQVQGAQRWPAKS